MRLIDADSIDIKKWFVVPADIQRIQAMLDESETAQQEVSQLDITKNIRMVDGKEVHTSAVEIWGSNGLIAEAGTNGYHGGDASHGCRTFVSIEDVGGTAIDISTFDHDAYWLGGKTGVKIVLGGDSELSTFIEALEFIVQTLKTQSREKT